MTATQTPIGEGRPEPGHPRERGARGFRREWVLLLALFVLLTVLASRFPWSGDDWAWGSVEGVDRVRSFFADYNGRYGGNLVVYALTRAGRLTWVVVAASLVATLWLVVDLSGRRTPLRYAVALLLFLAMPQDIWRQGVVWVSGFTNYGLAALGLLVYLARARTLWFAPVRRVPAALRVPAAVVTAFVAALFIEHVTLYLVGASLLFVAVHLVARRSPSGEGLGWALGFLAGAAAMFSNGAYRRALDGSSTYQRLGEATDAAGNAVPLGDKILGQVSAWVAGENTLVNVTLVVLVCVLAGRAHRDGVRQWPAVAVVLGVGALVVTVPLRVIAGQSALPPEVLRFSGLGLGLLVAMLVVTAAALVRDRYRRVCVAAATGSVVLVAAPTAVVQPIGPRLFYPVYVLFLVVVVLLLAEALPERMPDPVVPRLATAATGCALALLTTHVIVYALIHKAQDARVTTVRQAVDRGATEVAVDPLPFRGAVHGADPVDDVLEGRYKRFYRIPERIEITVRPYVLKRTVPPGG